MQLICVGTNKYIRNYFMYKIMLQLGIVQWSPFSFLSCPVILKWSFVLGLGIIPKVLLIFHHPCVLVKMFLAL